jgi:hypothetical protein
MRQLFGLTVGLYLTIAIAVFGGAAYGFVSGEHAPYSKCDAEPSWVPWAAYRAAAWPKAYYDDMKKAAGVNSWLVVQYDPFAGGCG